MLPVSSGSVISGSYLPRRGSMIRSVTAVMMIAMMIVETILK